ncbi:MAG TPA: hypothetical protein ENK18_20210 [Deltaproteobacteria bacterium]|nr:hypothetical protein [Deltaproteobacteria bacterium]
MHPILWWILALGCPRGPAPAALVGASSPDGVAEAFIEAAVARDRSALAELCSSRATEALGPLVDGTASPELMDELGRRYFGANVNDVRIDGNEARAYLVLPSLPGGAQILLRREGVVWRVIDF